MNNLVKPLEWKEKNSDLSLWEAALPGIALYRYKAHKFVGGKFVCRLQIDVFQTHTSEWEGRNFSTIEEAKAACDKHYEDFVGSLLSHNLLRTLVEHNYNF
jgi:hypothetical protein